MPRIVFATDPHITEGDGGGLAAFETDLAEIAALDPRPDLLVNGGDICLWEPGAGDRLADLLHDYPLPVVHLMGNHDTNRNGSPADFDADFSTRFHPRNVHVDLGAAHVIGLNTCRMDTMGQDWHNVVGAVDAEDLAWLDTTLATIDDRSLPLLVFVHIPVFTTYSDRRNASAADRAVWQVAEADAVLARLRHFDTCVVGQGHLHENEHLHREGVHFVNVGSVCGCWWQQGEATRCTDQAPRGWLVCDVADGDVALSYRAARAPASWQGEIVTQDDTRWLDLFFGDPAAPVEVRIGDTWRTLDPPSPQPVDERFVTTHRWRLPADAPDGELEVRTTMRGQPWAVGVVRARRD